MFDMKVHETYMTANMSSTQWSALHTAGEKKHLEEIQSPKPFPQAKVQRKSIKQNLLFLKKNFMRVSVWIYVEGQRTDSLGYCSAG